MIITHQYLVSCGKIAMICLRSTRCTSMKLKFEEMQKLDTVLLIDPELSETSTHLTVVCSIIGLVSFDKKLSYVSSNSDTLTETKNYSNVRMVSHHKENLLVKEDAY